MLRHDLIKLFFFLLSQIYHSYSRFGSFNFDLWIFTTLTACMQKKRFNFVFFSLSFVIRISLNFVVLCYHYVDDLKQNVFEGGMSGARLSIRCDDDYRMCLRSCSRETKRERMLQTETATKCRKWHHANLRAEYLHVLSIFGPACWWPWVLRRCWWCLLSTREEERQAMITRWWIDWLRGREILVKFLSLFFFHSLTTTIWNFTMDWSTFFTAR